MVSHTLNRRATWRREGCVWRLIAVALVSELLPAQVSDSTPFISPPPFKQLRYDESYAYLVDSWRRSDYLDASKFIVLNTDGKWYLTLGGEIRERYEFFHNNLWGRGPQDNDGYLLQRYMIHADAHFGDYFRVFT